MRAARRATHAVRCLLGATVLGLLLLGCKGAGSGENGGGKESGSTSGSSGSSGTKGGSGSGSAGSANGDASTPADSVKIDPANQARAGIRVGSVLVRSVPRDLIVAGQVMLDEKHTNRIGVLADGRIERVFVLPGDRVRAGQTLALLHSHLVHETVGALTQAYAAVERQKSGVHFAEINRDRYQHLLGLQVASQEEAQRADQQVQQAHQDLTDAEANVHMEREHLSELLQVPPSTLTRETLYTRELVPVRAVADGAVISRSITAGQVVNTGDEAFVVSDLRTVWVTASVNEKDLSRVRSGESAEITTQAYADSNFPASVAMVGDQLDPQTRTVPVRLSVANPSIRLRPGMFTTATIHEPATRTAVFVPEDALQDVNGLRALFVTEDGALFQVRAVKLGVRSGGLVEVLEGLKPTDHIVVSGAFMVKGELLKGSVGEG